MCIGPIRPRLMSCAASPNAVRWRRCSFSSPPGQNSGPPGARVLITARFRLVPLDRRQVRHMVEELAARHALAKEVIDGVAERTGGVPLFVEEVTRLLSGARRARRPPGDPADAATIVDGTARPARPSARGGAGRRRDRTRLLLRAHSRRGRDGGRAATGGARTARRSRHPAGAGPAAGIRLSVQARAHTGRGL